MHEDMGGGAVAPQRHGRDWGEPIIGLAIVFSLIPIFANRDTLFRGEPDPPAGHLIGAAFVVIAGALFAIAGILEVRRYRAARGPVRGDPFGLGIFFICLGAASSLMGALGFILPQGLWANLVIIGGLLLPLILTPALRRHTARR